MNKHHEQEEKEWKHRVEESERVRKSQQSVSNGGRLFLGLVFTSFGLYGVIKDWDFVKAGSPPKVLWHTARGLNFTTGDHLVACAGFAVVGIVALFSGIQQLRKRKKDNKGDDVKS